jgi:hypothetical protein
VKRGAMQRWRDLILPWIRLMKEAEPPPSTVRCPVCGERPMKTYDLTIKTNNDAGLCQAMQELRHEVAATIVCECGAETELRIRQTINVSADQEPQ